MAYIESAFRGYRLGIEWVESDATAEEAIASNSTTVTFSVYLRSTGSSWTITSSGTKTVTLYVDGKAYPYTAKGLSALSGNQKKILFTKTLNIVHNDDGTKSLAISAAFNIAVTLSGTYYDYVYCPESGTSTIALAQVPRPSTATLATTAVVGSAITISTNPASDNLTHTLSYSTDGGSTFTQFATGIGVSYSWTVPSALAEAIPNKTSGEAILRCATYNGNSLAGVRDTTFAFTLSAASSTPLISSLSVSQSNAAGITLFIAGKSTLTLTAIASLKLGASAAYYTFTVGNYSYRVDTDSSSASKSIMIPSSWSGLITCSVAVIDTRGIASAAYSKTITVTAYAAPVIDDSFEVVRGTGSGSNFVVDRQGTRIRITLSGAITSLGNANAKKYLVQYKYGSNNYTTIIPETTLSSYGYAIVIYPPTTFSKDINYTVRVAIIDSFSETAEIVTVRAQGVLMNFGADGNSWCFGGKATRSNAGEFIQTIHMSGGYTPTLISDGSNLNDYTTPGWYFCPSGSSVYNKASTSTTVFSLEVNQLDSSTIWQKFRYISGTTLTTFARYYDGAWQGWKQTEINVGHLYLPNISGNGSTGSIPYQQSTGKLTSLAPPAATDPIMVLSSGDGNTTPNWAEAKTIANEADATVIFDKIKQLVLDAAHPPGSIYFSYTDENPADLFGGTWEQIKDTFLLAAGDVYTAGATGGAPTFTIPAHKHLSPIGYSGSTFGAIDFTSSGNGTKSETAYGYKTIAATANSTNNYAGISKIYTQYNAKQTVDTMPPYTVYYVWRRTA